MSSRAKGARGELEAAELLRKLGYDARRSVQYNGFAGGPDLVTSVEGVHFEIKRTERLSPYQFMAQATRDSAKTKAKPVVLARSNNQDWLFIIKAGDLHEVIACLQRARKVSPFDGPEAQ